MYIWHLINWGKQFRTMGKEFFWPIPNLTITLFLPKARKVFKMLFIRASIFIVASTGSRNLSEQVNTGRPPSLLKFLNSSRFCIAKLIQRQKCTIMQRDFQELPVISMLALRQGSVRTDAGLCKEKERKEGIQSFSRGRRWCLSKLVRRLGSWHHIYASVSPEVIWIIICYKYGHRSEVCRSSYFYKFNWRTAHVLFSLTHRTVSKEGNLSALIIWLSQQP